MTVAILATGAPPAALVNRFGTYPDMFRNLLGPERVGATYDVTAGALPTDPRDHLAYLITGSAAGVYDPLPWIAPLKRFLQDAHGQASLIGICFGHQIMAAAFGGQVAKSDKGWGIGLQEYRLVAACPDSDGDRIHVPVSHQDQVIDPPPGAMVMATSAFCEIGALRYRDQSAISFQFHPEFEPDYAAALIELRRAGHDNTDAALESLRAPNDRARVGGWIKRFLDEVP
ncbi:MAG: GMP synthase [Sphingomicrobium sp.]